MAEGDLDLDLDFLDEDFELLDDEADDPFAPVPYERKQHGKKIGVLDTETDPFAPGYMVRPFCLGFMTAEFYKQFWGDDCVQQFFDWLATQDDEYVIYAHNGGKFDFFFLLEFLDHDTSPMIMGGRIVRIFFRGQEFRDSFAIIPEKLASYQKQEVDYTLFVRALREKHKDYILDYLKSDCQYLLDQVLYFYDRFGDSLTIASAALRQLNSYYGFERFHSDRIDEQFRHFYFGGRNQCFETGILKPQGKWLMIDRNSMYPAVMRDELHPISTDYELQDRITEETDFACIIAKNDGALPVRGANGGLDFTQKYGTFYATIHEIKAGLETGTLRIDHVKHAWAFAKKTTFADFINPTYEQRMAARARGDKLDDLNTKRVMNSSYGKFALNPRKFKKWLMTIGTVPEPMQSEENPDGWTLHSSTGDMYIWERPAPRRNGFYNVATAASITGAARANLLIALSNATRPIYCDTDSIICESYNGPLSDSELGGWKLEGVGTMAAIAGKKLYAIFDGEETLKKASKGCALTAQEIVSVCNGQEVMYRNPVPAFSLKPRNRTSEEFMPGAFATFIDRNIRMTGGTVGR